MKWFGISGRNKKNNKLIIWSFFKRDLYNRLKDSKNQMVIFQEQRTM